MPVDAYTVTATAILAAMATDTWKALSGKCKDLVRRRGGVEGDQAATRLDTISTALVNVDDSEARKKLEGAFVDTVATDLKAAVDTEPALMAALLAIRDEALAAQAAHRSVSANTVTAIGNYAGNSNFTIGGDFNVGGGGR